MFENRFKLRHFFYITLYLITKVDYCEFNNNVHQRSFRNTTVMQFFRFRDFEPRYAFQTNSHRTFENKRKARGFQFHTDDRDFNVDLEFIVPFVRIPIERGMTATRTAFRSLLNLNVHSIFTTGAIVVIGGFLAIIFKIIFTQYALTNNYRKSFRNNDLMDQNSEIFYHTYSGNVMKNILNITEFATAMEEQFQENNIDISHCVQSYLCNYVKENFYKANKTCNEGLHRVLNGIFSLESVQDYLSGTPIKTTLDIAKSGDNCFKAYSNCNLLFPSSGMLKFLVANLKHLFKT